jgi:hypothetical protein
MYRKRLGQPSGLAAARPAHPRPRASRPSLRDTARIVATASLCLLAAGCAGADVGRDAVGWVPPGEERLSLVAAARPDQRQAVRYADEWQAEEYARVRSAGLQLEYLYVTADPGSPVSLDSSFDLVRAVGLFRRNQEVGVSGWGGLGRVEKPGGTLFYRPYRLGSRACFGFEGDLGRGGEDPLGRPYEILLGYGCADAGMLSATRIEAILDGIGMRRVVNSARLPSLPSAGTALDFARGKADADQGLGSFPLLLAQHYALADADEAW